MSDRGTIEIQIDELVLHGFDPRDRHAIGDALQAELARLVAAAAPDLTRRADVARVDAGGFEHPASGPAAIGRAAAAVLHRSLS